MVDVVDSPALSPEQKELVLRRFENRIGKDGAMRVISQETRSLAENKELAIKRFAELVRDAVRQVRIRRRHGSARGLSSGLGGEEAARLAEK